jgi:two-component system phosphate regulon response regulator OmpR
MSGTRILVVEDDPQVRELCVYILGALGYTVTAVDDGALALQEIDRAQPGLILLDLLMPRAQLDGLGLLSTLAATPSRTIPVIVMSALGDAMGDGVPREVREAFHIGAVLSKPVSLTTLAREVRRLISPDPRP